jgi:hypothetical protein
MPISGSKARHTFDREPKIMSQLTNINQNWFHWNEKPYYIGVWTNWSKGKILGGTLTLPSNEAKVLLALVALFLATVGERTWSKPCLAFNTTKWEMLTMIRNIVFSDPPVVFKRISVRWTLSPSAGRAKKYRISRYDAGVLDQARVELAQKVEKCFPSTGAISNICGASYSALSLGGSLDSQSYH